MQSPLAGVTFLIYFAFLAAAVQEFEAASAPAALPDLREGLWWVFLFSLLSASTGFIRAHILVGAGQICGLIQFYLHDFEKIFTQCSWRDTCRTTPKLIIKLLYNINHVKLATAMKKIHLIATIIWSLYKAFQKYNKYTWLLNPWL